MKGDWEKNILKHKLKKVLTWECLYAHRRISTILVRKSRRRQDGREDRNLEPVENLLLVLNQVFFCVALNDHEAVQSEAALVRRTTTTEGTNGRRNNRHIASQSITGRCYDVEGHAGKCVARYCELVGKFASASELAESSFMDGHQFHLEI